MAMLHGFELEREQYIRELRTHAQLFRHAQTGAELLSLSNDDENKVFGISFRTPPSDSTGVAHILEHSVLCGSRKYPVKEPFVELLKGSLKTFLNAFTYPDKTCYPVASQNLLDFYNLIDVYLDAVFYPRITSFIFQQEGWHWEMEAPDLPLTCKGVVFNEMKGAYSSPDSVLSELSQQSIFPDITYSLDSGGNPKEIPKLTFEQFRAFHQKYYHPSNARIFFYGDDDPKERLHLMNEYLKEFEKASIDSKVRLQPHGGSPRRITKPFAAGGDGTEGQSTSSKGMITVNWLLAEAADPELNLGLQVLRYILLGMPGSPLRKALIDSGLGDDLAGVGLETELRQMYFSTGLKGIDVENADRIESLIMGTLQSLAQQGIDPKTVEAAFNTIEFHLRENNSGSYPKGLVLMLRALTTWLHESDPMALLAFETPYSNVKARAASNPAYFQELIERFFLKNTHRTTVILTPDSKLAEAEETAEREKLATMKETLTRDQVDLVIKNTHELKRIQETPDPPEALSTIPMLKITDLDRKNKTIPIKILKENGATILLHDIFTNGIVYVDMGFDLSTLPIKYLPYAPLFGRALVEMGTESEDFVSLTQRISRETGGIRPEFATSTVKGSEKGSAWLFLRGKSTLAKTQELLRILHDVLLTLKMDNQDRFRQMVLEEKARNEHKLIPSGHQIVNLRLRAHFSEADWTAEQMAGISYLLFVRKLASEVESNWPNVLEALEEMRNFLVNRATMIFNVTVDEGGWKEIEPRLSALITSLPSKPTAPPRDAVWSPKYPPTFEGMVIPAQVNYVGKGTNLYRLGYQFHGSSQVISRYLSTSWLWDSIRVRGGAYGAFCLFDRHSGTFTLVSYRDPNLLKTLENFDRTAEFLRSTPLDSEELTKAIIGAIGNMDAYLLPDSKGYISMLRHLIGDTDDDRQKMRDEILATSPADFRQFADVLDRVTQEGIVKVLGSQSAIDESCIDRPDWLTRLRVI